MNARKILAAPIAAAVVAGPYLAMEDEWRRPLQQQWSSLTGAPSNVTPDPTLSPAVELAQTDLALAPPTEETPPNATPEDPAPVPPLDASQARFAGAPVSDLAEVIRFDVSPEWLFSRWSRVTTITADQSLKGFRAPLVTGPRVDDLAGVATYYFGRHGRLQRFTFEGHTGDSRRLVNFLTQNFGFTAQPTLGAGLYLVTWNAKPTSGLRIDYAPVVRADAPHLRYTVKLEINRPDEAYHMSDDFRQILEQDQQTNRWRPY